MICDIRAYNKLACIQNDTEIGNQTLIPHSVLPERWKMGI